MVVEIRNYETNTWKEIEEFTKTMMVEWYLFNLFKLLIFIKIIEFHIS